MNRLLTRPVEKREFGGSGFSAVHSPSVSGFSAISGEAEASLGNPYIKSLKSLYKLRFSAKQRLVAICLMVYSGESSSADPPLLLYRP
jgi:hypothetical protein